MIPKNIKREHVIKAIEEIKRNGIPKGRDSKKFLLKFNGEYYPPKYVISLANKYANGEMLDPAQFSGGKETNDFLRNLGFDIIEISKAKRKNKPSRKRERNLSNSQHDERCPKCKETIRKLLEKIYGRVEENYKFRVGTSPEDFKNSPYYSELRKIYKKLQDHRGYRDFVKAKTLPNCDFFIPNPGFIVEFDESQHFTLPRKLTLEEYPTNLKLGFSKEKWIRLCEEIDAKDNDPPYRDEQRAWYDTLRDFLPTILGLQPTVRLFAKDFVWCSLDPENPRDVGKFKEFIEYKNAKLTSWLATVIPHLDEKQFNKLSNEDRFNILENVVNYILSQIDSNSNGVILFPAGWFDAQHCRASSLYNWIESNTTNLLKNYKDREIIISVGIDGRDNKDQIAIAVSKNGIKAIGRKFYPTGEEKGFIEVATSYLSKENGRTRIFELNGKRYFMCVCYDIFGIKHNELRNPGVDIVLNLIHGFKKGESEANFTRHGLAGASAKWKCRVFASAKFFKPIPKKWPSAVYWNSDKTYSSSCTYTKISINPLKEFYLNINDIEISVRIFKL